MRLCVVSTSRTARITDFECEKRMIRNPNDSIHHLNLIQFIVGEKSEAPKPDFVCSRYFAAGSVLRTAQNMTNAKTGFHRKNWPSISCDLPKNYERTRRFVRTERSVMRSGGTVRSNRDRTTVSVGAPTIDNNKGNRQMGICEVQKRRNGAASAARTRRDSSRKNLPTRKTSWKPN